MTSEIYDSCGEVVRDACMEPRRQSSRNSFPNENDVADFKEWMSVVDFQGYKMAYCDWCRQVISRSNVSSLSRHASTAKHMSAAPSCRSSTPTNGDLDEDDLDEYLAADEQAGPKCSISENEQECKPQLPNQQRRPNARLFCPRCGGILCKVRRQHFLYLKCTRCKMQEYYGSQAFEERKPKKSRIVCCLVPNCNHSSAKIDAWKIYGPGNPQYPCPRHKSEFVCSCTEPYTMISFPQDPHLRRLWFALVKRNSWFEFDPRRHAICSLHFVDEKVTDRLPFPIINLGLSKKQFVEVLRFFCSCDDVLRFSAILDECLEDDDDDSSAFPAEHCYDRPKEETRDGALRKPVFNDHAAASRVAPPPASASFVDAGKVFLSATSPAVTSSRPDHVSEVSDGVDASVKSNATTSDPAMETPAPPPSAPRAIGIKVVTMYSNRGAVPVIAKPAAPAPRGIAVVRTDRRRDSINDPAIRDADGSNGGGDQSSSRDSIVVDRLRDENRFRFVDGGSDAVVGGFDDGPSTSGGGAAGATLSDDGIQSEMIVGERGGVAIGPQIHIVQRDAAAAAAAKSRRVNNFLPDDYLSCLEPNNCKPYKQITPACSETQHCAHNKVFVAQLIDELKSLGAEIADLNRRRRHLDDDAASPKSRTSTCERCADLRRDNFRLLSECRQLQNRLAGRPLDARHGSPERRGRRGVDAPPRRVVY